MPSRTPTRALLLLALLALPLSAADDWPPKPIRIAGGVSGHIHPAACVTKAGTVLVVFSRADFKDLRLTRSVDGGKTWSEPTPFPGAEKTDIYPGSLTTLKDGRVVHAWNVWYKSDKGEKSRHVRLSVSGDDGKTWSEPKDLPKNPDAQSVVRHPVLELA
ncbi:MAG TPA: sialidase family protein, partial [Gemmataceae bacterium]|nr:sialidase family protein [Gemmataceae bacterium]